MLRDLDVHIGCHECLRIPDGDCLRDGAVGLHDELVEIDDVGCNVKDKVDHEVECDVLLKEVDEVLEVDVNPVMDARDTACMIYDVQLLQVEEERVLVVDESLQLDAGDRLGGDGVVNEVVHHVECTEVFIADVNEVAEKDVVVVDVGLGSIVKDVAVILKDGVELLINTDVVE